MQLWLRALHCPATAACVTAERRFLNALDGSCRTPIAAHAEISGDELVVTGRLLSDEGNDCAEGQMRGSIADAAALGNELAAQLRAEKPHLVRGR
jgi:hydroxymethylbilane synthase